MWESIKNWEFLNETPGQWIIFIVALSLFMGVWRGILDHIKGEV